MVSKDSKEIEKDAGLDDKHVAAALAYLQSIGAVASPARDGKWEPAETLPRAVTDSLIGQKIRKSRHAASP